MGGPKMDTPHNSYIQYQFCNCQRDNCGCAIRETTVNRCESCSQLTFKQKFIPSVLKL